MIFSVAVTSISCGIITGAVTSSALISPRSWGAINGPGNITSVSLIYTTLSILSPSDCAIASAFSDASLVASARASFFISDFVSSERSNPIEEMVVAPDSVAFAMISPILSISVVFTSIVVFTLYAYIVGGSSSAE